MKYKVAAEVGDVEEIEAFKLYEKTMVESRGEEQYRLFAKKAQNEPVLRFLDWAYQVQFGLEEALEM